MENPDQAAPAAEEIVAPVEAEASEPALETVAEEPTPAAEDAPAAEVVEEAAPVVAEPTSEADLANEAEEPVEQVEEHIVDGLIDGDTLVPMSHPDNGSCDAYDTDANGHWLVPAIDVPAMLSHGFVVAAGDE